jgi:hypothetical protein
MGFQWGTKLASRRAPLGVPQGFEKVAFKPISDLGQFLPGVLQEMWRSTMRFQSGVIFILLIDEEAAWLRSMRWT